METQSERITRLFTEARDAHELKHKLHHLGEESFEKTVNDLILENAGESSDIYHMIKAQKRCLQLSEQLLNIINES